MSILKDTCCSMLTDNFVIEDGETRPGRDEHVKLELSVAHEASSKPAGGTGFGKLNFNVSYTCELNKWLHKDHVLNVMVRMRTVCIRTMCSVVLLYGAHAH